MDTDIMVADHNFKRLREEKDDLRDELAQRVRDYDPGTRYESERNGFLSAENTRLRWVLADMEVKLAAEVAAVDELLEFKASQSVEATRRLMCPRVSQ